MHARPRPFEQNLLWLYQQMPARDLALAQVLSKAKNGLPLCVLLV